MGVKPEELENLENVDDFDAEEFDDSPEARGDFVDPDEAEEETEDEPEEETEEETEDELEDEPEEETEGGSETTDESAEEEIPEVELAEEEHRVPISRLKAEIAKRRELESRLADQGRQNKGAEKKTSRLEELTSRQEELDAEIAEAVLEGDTKKYAQLRAEDRKINAEIIDLSVHKGTTEAINRTKYDAALDEVERDFPALNPDSEAFNQDMTDEVLELKQSLELRGHTPETALRMAVDYVAPRYDTAPAPRGLRESAKPKRSTTTPKKRNQHVKQAQAPAAAGRKSVAEARPSVMEMSEDEIENLDPKLERELRGDFL